MDLKDPWLVAVWPGMGSVALAAGAYLSEKLQAEELSEIPTQPYFDVDRISVDEGVVSAAQTPRARFYGWRNPSGRDLIVFVGEAQPQTHGYQLCRDLLEVAQRHGVSRVFTFAAMATPMHPRTTPRVFAVATTRELVDEVAEQEVEVLTSGEITGLNGVLLAAAHERGLGGVCLLGEFPYFASRVPNPAASNAVLRVFSAMANVALDFTDLEEQAKAVQRGLIELVDRMQSREQGDKKESFLESLDLPEELQQSLSGQSFQPGEDSETSGQETEQLTSAQRDHIEGLFDEAESDRGKATELKAELDRHGIFKEYEDRFLDLFRSGE
jgi:uncharacterized protein